MNVYLDGADDEQRIDALALHAVRLEASRNGWAVPVVTAEEFARFITAWSVNDPNGSWDPSGITERDGALVYTDGEHDEPDVWSRAGIVAGQAVYALEGWTWHYPNHQAVEGN